MWIGFENCVFEDVNRRIKQIRLFWKASELISVFFCEIVRLSIDYGLLRSDQPSKPIRIQNPMQKYRSMKN